MELSNERTHNESHVGSLGWLALGAGVVLWDATAEESLTHAFGRGMENAVSRPAVLVALGVTAAHLLDLLPHALDPFYRIAEYFGHEV